MIETQPTYTNYHPHIRTFNYVTPCLLIISCPSIMSCRVY